MEFESFCEIKSALHYKISREQKCSLLACKIMSVLGEQKSFALQLRYGIMEAAMIRSKTLEEGEGYRMNRLYQEPIGREIPMYLSGRMISLQS